ncbi:hypothetical protein Tco_0058201 [Tanacetum coccineum]
MEDPEQAFVEYASSCTDEAGGLVSNFMASQDARLSKFEADFKQQQSEMTNKMDTVLKAITYQIAGTLPSDTVKNPKLNASQFYLLILTQIWTRNAQTMSKLRLVPQSSDTKVICTKRDDIEVMFIELIRKNDDSSEREPEEEGSTKGMLRAWARYVTGMDDEGEVTLYLMRRSLEVLRKFHWMILGGQSNQLLHVSSPLLSKPGEY